MTKEKLPAAASRVAERHPDIWKAYAQLGEACADAGPIKDDTRRLIKLALAIGAGSEGAVHSHARRAIEEGHSREAVEHVAMLAISTLGFPQAVAAMTWIEDVTRR